MSDDSTNTQPPGQGGDTAPNAELTRLEKEMRALDAQPAAQAAKEQGAVALSATAQNRGELHAALRMARDALLPLIALRSERKAVMLAAIWSDDTLEAVAKSGAEVLTLHGVALHSLTAGFGPYIGLALSLGPAVVGTAAVLRAPDPQPAEVVEPTDGQQQSS